MARSTWDPLEKEVGSELIKRRALSTRSGKACSTCCSNSCVNTWFGWMSARLCKVLVVILITLSLITLIALAVAYVHPYFAFASYKKTTCVIKSVDDSEKVDCSCGSRCHADTFCIKVDVEYTTSDGEVKHGRFHENDLSGEDKCTAAPCDYSREARALSIMETVDKYKNEKGTPFSCMYDPEGKNTNIIRHQEAMRSVAIHMIVWPLVVFLLCVSQCVFLVHICGVKYTGKHPPQNVKVIAVRLRICGIHTLKGIPDQERQRLVRECDPGETPEDTHDIGAVQV